MLHRFLGVQCEALASAFPQDAPGPLRDARIVGCVFFAGSIFFTSAAWLQWLEALNADVATAFESAHVQWRWIGWCPRNLGYLACAVQLVGTLLFNFNTADALISALSWGEQDLVIWVPDMLGSVCFLVASYLAYAEVSHGAASFAPRNVSWWIAIVNLLGSFAFQLSASMAFAGPSPAPSDRVFWSTVWTAVGALGFRTGAYLMIPEPFDVPTEKGRASAR